MNMRAVWMVVVMCVAALPVWAQEIAPATDPLSAAPPPPSQLKSLFFSDEEREAIAQARVQYQERLQGPSEADLLDQLQGIKDALKPEESLEDRQYEQFYLESLIYHTPGDWTLWIKTIRGSEKFAPDTVAAPKNTLQLVAVNKENATFEWKPKNWAYVSKKYTDKNTDILLDAANKTVTFTLWVNQTMGSFDMTIIEGEATIVPIADGTAAPTAATTPTTENKKP